MEMTTLPASSSRTEPAVGAAESHGVATTTTSAPAAGRCRPPAAAGRGRANGVAIFSHVSRARSFEREPMVTSMPTDASRAANRCRPALSHPGSLRARLTILHTVERFPQWVLSAGSDLEPTVGF